MLTRYLIFISVFIGLTICSANANSQIQTVEEYNHLLPKWGTSWSPSARSVNGYNTSFYTGFAPRVQAPDRIHVHMGRGNQTRVTVILDDATLRDYLFDLSKRADFYRRAQSAKWIDVNPASAAFTSHVQAYDQIVKSPRYGIDSFVRTAQSASEPEIYSKSLSVLKALNSDRVFSIRFDLANEFMKWRKAVQQVLTARELSEPETAALAMNMMLLGRVNFVDRPTDQMIADLNSVLTTRDENEFILKARDLFLLVTQGKYSFRVLNSQGQMVPALQCPSAQSCTLSYTEFTAVYPMGTVKSMVDDMHGNQIPALALPGIWNFSSMDLEVDAIRPEPYYGFIPFMSIGTPSYGLGFHNPAVRFYQVDPSIKSILSIPSEHSTYWSVKRGGVSHGCSRLPAGHTWEMRHILPVEDTKMRQVRIFANLAQEFDVFDVNGDGVLEVVGVDYLLSYDLQGASNLLSREGQDLQVGNQKTQFYRTLYGAKNVFQVSNGHYLFKNPVIPVHTFADVETRMVKQRLSGPSLVPLYEQSYEQDKLQFYDPADTNQLDGHSQAPTSKRLVRIFGRIRGCAPTADKSSCGEAAFENEVRSVTQGLGKPL